MNKLIATALLTTFTTATYATDVSDNSKPAPEEAKPASASEKTDNQPTEPTKQAVLDCNYHIASDTKTIDQKLITDWAKKAAVQTFSFAPDQIQQQLDELKACFTPKGWTSFSDAFEKSGNITAIKTQELTVSSQIEGDANISEVKDDRWKVTIPMEVIYQNKHDKITQILNVDLLIGRKTSGDLGIMQVIATPKQTETADDVSKQATNIEPEKKSTPDT